MVSNFVFRFAPSPNGRLHLGHAYSALLNADLAARTGGRFLLRLEDIDRARCTPELAAHCLSDLEWLGLRWEHPVRVQSRHFADYSAALNALDKAGLLYPCFCSRSEIAAKATSTDPEGAPLYPGTCADLTPAEADARIEAGEPRCWRLHSGMALLLAPSPHRYRRFDAASFKEETVPAHPEQWGDVILARKDTPTSYHLSVVVDDALQGITHVVRGQDLEAATDIHVLLQALLRLPTPKYHHHALLMEKDGESKLSKSKYSETLQDWKIRGASPAQLRQSLGFNESKKRES